MIAATLAAVLAATLASAGTAPGVRVKDIAALEGVRGNALMGYGLVVGLKGTGDRRQTVFTAQSLRNLLERQGLSFPPAAIRVANVAGVAVTATLPPFARPGTRLDINVASLGDASSLEGGVLLFTTLAGPDGRVYATAQGPLVIGGASAESPTGGTREQINHPTVGRVVGGALTEVAAPTALAAGAIQEWLLERPDFATAARLAAAINEALGGGCARAQDARRVSVDPAAASLHDPVALAAAIGDLRVTTDGPARVVVNERTGTVVAGLDVRLKPVSIIHGGLTIDVRTELEVSQPRELATGQTVTTPRETVEVRPAPARNLDLQEGATIEDLTRGLMAMGATATDVIEILQALHDAGALEAEVEVI